MSRFLPVFVSGLLLLACASHGAPRPDELDGLHQELDALRKSQQLIGQDVAEIKKMLQAMQPPPPARPIDADLDIANAPVKGRKDARLTLVEFSDYQCPFCKRHVMATLPQIERDYIATGKLRYVFRDFPMESIHAQAPKAAEAAHCAGEQGQYWEMHDKLFATQDALGPENLMQLAGTIGLKVEPFRACMDGGRHAQRIRNDIAEAEKLGVQGTPTLFIGVGSGDRIKLVKMVVGALPYRLFKDELDKLLVEMATAK
jgi:protein-disulfide isomerase